MINKTNLFQRSLTVTTLVLCSGVSFVLVARSPQIAHAQEPTSIRFNPANLEVPASIGEPKGRGAGGRRGCNTNDADDQLIPLVPTMETSDRAVRWGLTTRAHPTFWLHSPKGFQNGALIWLSVFDQTNHLLYRIPFQIPKISNGVVRFAVPSTAPPLQLNTPYRWQFTVYCNSSSNDLANLTFDTPFIMSGGVQRVQPSAELQKRLAIAKTPLEQATFYAENGIWYDSLTTLGNSVWDKKTSDTAMPLAWIELLQQSNLKASAAAPIVKCCIPKQSQP
ncbi:MAG: DUF928 domain-containing protein [Oscillatoriales cyanobacterium C42_A2020_001]|nr:DUF928 domain-containing protein [Leptolyngbyaceae cyanobacterium C42_A2020_001]